MIKRSNNTIKKQFKGATATLILGCALLPATFGVAYAADIVTQAQLPSVLEESSASTNGESSAVTTTANESALSEQSSAEIADGTDTNSNTNSSESDEMASEAKNDSKSSNSKKKTSKKLTTAQKAVKLAKKQIGVAYVWAGCSPSGFDCSGLIKYVYGKLGVSLSHNAQAQYSEGEYVSKEDLKPGDLVFFGGSTSSISHVGMYVGNGKYIHSPQPGETVCIASLADRTNYVGACRVA